MQNVRVTAQAAVPSGQARQIPSGLMGVVQDPTLAYQAGDRVDFATDGQWTMSCNPAVALLDGGRAYWSYANEWIDFRKSNDTRDSYAGRIIGDSPVGQGTCTVLLNANPSDAYDLARDPYYCAPIGTQALGGFLPAQRNGGALRLSLDAVNQAEKVDALGKLPGFLPNAPGVVEMAIEVVSGSGSSPVLSVGIASGTHATAVTSIAQYLCARINGGSTAIDVEAADGTHTLAPTATGQTYTAGTRFELWFDMRAPGAVTVYVNGVQVLTSTAINVSAASAAWFLLAHLVKTATTDTLVADIDWLRMRTMRL